MLRKRLYMVLGVLALFVLVFSAVSLQRQSSNLKALQASALDFCSKESVKVDGQELWLQAKDFVKLTDSAKEQYGVRDAEGQKTLLLEFAVLEKATQTETLSLIP